MSFSSSVSFCVEIDRNRPVFPVPFGVSLAPRPAGHQGSEQMDQIMLMFMIYFHRCLYHSLGIPSHIQKKKGTLHLTCVKSTAAGQDCLRSFLQWRARAWASASHSLSHSLSLALQGHRIIKIFKTIESNVLIISRSSFLSGVSLKCGRNRQ